jgi:hypothetical protein
MLRMILKFICLMMVHHIPMNNFQILNQFDEKEEQREVFQNEPKKKYDLRPR